MLGVMGVAGVPAWGEAGVVEVAGAGEAATGVPAWEGAGAGAGVGVVEVMGVGVGVAGVAGVLGVAGVGVGAGVLGVAALTAAVRLAARVFRLAAVASSAASSGSDEPVATSRASAWISVTAAPTAVLIAASAALTSSIALMM